MMKIRIFTVGKYRLCIKAEAVMAVRKAEVCFSGTKEPSEPKSGIVHLASLLSTPSANPGTNKGTVMEIKTVNGPMLLLVDADEGEITGPDRVTPLPPVLNGLSRRCFPGVLIHEGELVLLLEPTELIRAGLEMEKNSE